MIEPNEGGEAFVFTDEDTLFPVWCTQCRQQIPRAVSNANQGICPKCVRGNQVAQQATLQAQQVALASQQQANLQQQQAIFSANTGMGKCPQCGSTNIYQFDNLQPVDNSLKTTACLLGCLCAWPMLLVAPFVGNQKKTGTSRACKSCGNRWPV